MQGVWGLRGKCGKERPQTAGEATWTQGRWNPESLGRVGGQTWVLILDLPLASPPRTSGSSLEQWPDQVVPYGPWEGPEALMKPWLLLYSGLL